MRLILSFIALFLSVVLLQLSSGGVGPLDALSGLGLGFSSGQIGLLGSAHFAGFFLGCWWAPRLMGAVGAGRSFAVFTSLGAMGLLGHTLIVDPTAWTFMRVASGLCIAGSYTVIEAWLQAKVTNESRGRTMGIYRVVDISGSLLAQLMIGALADLETYLAYNILTLICCAALLPLAMTRVSQPKVESAPRLKPLLALHRSPLAVSGVIVAGMTGASFRMVGPLYGAEVGLDAEKIGYFLALFVLGGALAQYPAGWAADKFDRRYVLIGFSLAALVSCAISASVSGDTAVLVAALLFGATTFPVYSVAAAHAHDFAQDTERVELSAALLFFFALGAIIAPLSVSWLIEAYGPKAFFAFISVGHVVLVIFGILRMRVRPTREGEERTRYVYAPRTTLILGRLLGQSRKR